MALEVPTSLSPSRGEAFTSCPQAFRFASIDKIPEPPMIHMSRGTLVHRALELLQDAAGTRGVSLWTAAREKALASTSRDEAGAPKKGVDAFVSLIASMRAATAGLPLPEIIEHVQQVWGKTIREGYGQTETTIQIDEEVDRA